MTTCLSGAQYHMSLILVFIGYLYVSPKAIIAAEIARQLPQKIALNPVYCWLFDFLKDPEILQQTNCMYTIHIQIFICCQF